MLRESHAEADESAHEGLAYCEQLPGIPNSFLLEIVPKGPVAQHLKEGVMVHILTNIIQVIMLAASTYTLQH